MEKMKHTPGPWRWEWNGTAGNEFLASGSMQDGTFKWVGTKGDKLVQAAAPELLEALDGLHSLMSRISREETRYTHPAMMAARDAIAKATQP